MADRLRQECHIADFCAPHDSNVQTAEVREWMRQAQAAGVAAVMGNDGNQRYADYVVDGEIEITRPGQVIRWDQTGGFGYNDARTWYRGTRLVAVGPFTKQIRTRRKYRLSDVSPKDAAMSCVLNIQAEGVQLHDPCIWLQCNYSDLSPSNYGSYCDVGIFIGTRVGVKMIRPQVIGYFRRYGICVDVTNADNMPRFPDLNGNPYPGGTVKNGSDGWVLEHPYIKGSNIGLGIMGARPKGGYTDYSADYYDDLLGAAVPDRRGTFGASDGLVVGGWIHSVDHHSNYRRMDPTRVNSVLDYASLYAEPDHAPAALCMDGLAGNSSTNLWGARFLGTRFATSEMFRVRLRKHSRAMFIGCHIEGRNSGSERDTQGNLINTNDYRLRTYGDISGEKTTDRVIVLGTVRSDESALFPHFYGDQPTYLTDAGKLSVPTIET